MTSNPQPVWGLQAQGQAVSILSWTCRRLCLPVDRVLLLAHLLPSVHHCPRAPDSGRLHSAGSTWLWLETVPIPRVFQAPDPGRRSPEQPLTWVLPPLLLIVLSLSLAPWNFSDFVVKQDVWRMFNRLNLNQPSSVFETGWFSRHCSVPCCQRWNLGPGYSVGVLEPRYGGERAMEPSVLSTVKWFLCASWQQD